MNHIITDERVQDTATGADRAAEPCTLALFGASGDLTQRMIMPAIFRLAAILLETIGAVGASKNVDADGFPVKVDGSDDDRLDGHSHRANRLPYRELRRKSSVAASPANIEISTVTTP